MTKTLLLYLATVVAEIVGCYLPYCYVKRDGSAVVILCGVIIMISGWRNGAG